jgi:hypothetical protein
MKPKYFRSDLLAVWCVMAFCVFAVAQKPGIVPGPRPGPGPSKATPPVLTITGPGSAAQGATGLQLTIQGSGFHPGASVVISPPLANVAQSSANNQATDISVDSVTVLNAQIIIAVISVSPSATPGMRAVDVVNLDRTTTGSRLGQVGGSSKPLRITPGNALGAPLAVTTIAVTSPRNGSLVMQGEELYGTAALAGTGNGTVIGAWLWDGNVTEQFTEVFAGGNSVALRSKRSFPTSMLGVHTVELRIQKPNQIVSRPITVIINPGDWKLEHLIAPAYGARVASEEPPTLRWEPVPGVAKYQIGFAAKPYFSSVKSWHEVTDNRWTVPREVWESLPEGEIYWTVRAVEMSGVARKGLPMRLLLRFPAGALGASAPHPAGTPQGNLLLEWQALKGSYLYRITITEDAEGSRLVRRYLTGNPKVDLRALKGKLNPAKTYYWHVDAVAPDGRIILIGPTQSFSAASGPSSSRRTAPDVPHLILAAFRPRTTAWNMAAQNIAPPNMAEPPEDIKTLVGRTPEPESTITDAQAPVVIQFTAAPEMLQLALMIDGADVTSLTKLEEAKLSYTPAIPWVDGEHNINLSVGPEAIAWKFTAKTGVQAATAPAQNKTDAETPPEPTAQSAGPEPGTTSTPPGSPPRLQTHTQLGATTQWASGSQPDTNTLTLGQQLNYQPGNWIAQINGSSMLNSTLNPEMLRHSLARADNYVTSADFQRPEWGTNVRLGALAPTLYQNSQFVTPATPRPGVETNLKTPAGTFGLYVNLNDLPLGGGPGFTFHQQLLGAGWDLPLPKKYAELRLMWLSAKEDGLPADPPGGIVTRGGGDLYGERLLLHLSSRWLWTSEYAWGYDTQDLFGTSHHLFGRAWQTGISGTIKNASLNVSYLDVSQNFTSPANPHLSPMSTPGRNGVNATLTLPTKAGTFVLGEQFLRSNLNDPNTPDQRMNAVTESWSWNLDPKTVFSAAAHQTLIGSGDLPAAVLLLTPVEQRALEADQRDVGANLAVTRQVGKVSMNLSGSRDWLRNNLNAQASVITSSILAGANWNYSTFFQLNSSFGVNWTAADKTTLGGTRALSYHLQPTFVWARAGLQMSPLAAFNQSHTELLGGFLTNDNATSQYGGQTSWTMPRALKFSTLSFQGNISQNRNLLTGTNLRNKSLLLIWTIIWGHQKAT